MISPEAQTKKDFVSQNALGEVGPAHAPHGYPALFPQPRLYPIAAIFSETFIRQRTGPFFLKGEAATQIIYHFSPQELAALGT